jgi:hypothetical protein
VTLQEVGLNQGCKPGVSEARREPAHSGWGSTQLLPLISGRVTFRSRIVPNRAAG